MDGHDRWVIRLVLLAGLMLGGFMLVTGFIFGICGSMEYTTACNGPFARDPDGPYWAVFVLICLFGLVYSSVRRPAEKKTPNGMPSSGLGSEKSES
jgi:hypothetical protein